jgi:hypothetical protein
MQLSTKKFVRNSGQADFLGQMGQNWVARCSEVIQNMMARNGVEPPMPVVSELTTFGHPPAQ